MPAPNRSKTVLCNNDNCKYGLNCNFAHGINQQSYINPLIGQLDNKINTINYKKIYDALEKLYLSDDINKKVIQEICENLKYNPKIPNIAPENFIELYKIWHTLATFARNPKNNYSNKFKLYETEDDTEALMALRYVSPCKIDENKINFPTAKICIYGKNCNFGHRSNSKQVCIKDLTFGHCDCNETLSNTQYPYIHLVRDFGHEPLQVPVKNTTETINTTYETEFPLLSTNTIKTIVSINKKSYTDICSQNIKFKLHVYESNKNKIVEETPVSISNEINPNIVGNDCQIALNNPELFKQYEQTHPTYNITFTSWLIKDPLKSQAYNLVLFHNISFNNALYYVKNKLKEMKITVNEFIAYVNKYKIKSVNRWIEVNKKLNSLDNPQLPFDTFRSNENNYYDYYITTEYYKHNTFDVYCQEKNDSWNIATKQGVKYVTKNKINVLKNKKDRILTRATGMVITKCFE